MSTVLNRTTKELRPSVNTPDFPVADWIINPNLAAVVGQPTKYFIITGDVVTLATPAQQATIDAAILAAQVAAARIVAKANFDVARILKAIAELLVDEFNILRPLHGLGPRTFAQLRTAIRSKIDTG